MQMPLTAPAHHLLCSLMLSRSTPDVQSWEMNFVMVLLLLTLQSFQVCVLFSKLTVSVNLVQVSVSAVYSESMLQTDLEQTVIMLIAKQ